MSTNEKEIKAYNAIKRLEKLYEQYEENEGEDRSFWPSYEIPFNLLNITAEEILPFILDDRKYSCFETYSIKRLKDCKIVKEYLVSVDIWNEGSIQIRVRKLEDHSRQKILEILVAPKVHGKRTPLSTKLIEILKEHDMLSAKRFQQVYGYSCPKALTNSTSVEVPKTSKLERLGIKHIYENSEKRNVTVVWADNTSTSSTCAEGDEYDFSVGLSLCIAKHNFTDYHKFTNNIKSRKKYYTAVKSKAKKSK